MADLKIDSLDAWLKHEGPVALIIKQPLASVDEDENVIFPPTYPLTRWNGRKHFIREGDYRVTVELPPDAKLDKSESKSEQRPGYNIDRFQDGTNVCEIDSPQSQSNRVEPRFKEILDGTLVPKIEIAVGEEKVNLLDVGHRSADAVVRMSSLSGELHDAFVKAKTGNFFELAKYAPTSLVFGVWDSRSTYVKVQRAFKAQIRATNVCELTRSAQYTPAVNYVDAGAINEDVEAGKKEEENNMSQEGMKHALSTQTVGGVKLTDRSQLKRTVNVNVAAIRALKGDGDPQTKALQRYVLGLALVAALDEPDLNLREGCNLQFKNGDESKASIKLVYRSQGQEKFESSFDDVVRFTEKAFDAFLKEADLDREKANCTDVVFETGVAEDFLKRSKKDRKKISQLGPITKQTLMRFDAQGKDPFKPVSDLLKNTKKSLGRKPPKSKPRKKDAEAFKEVASALESMSTDSTLPEGVPELAGKLLKMARDHEDSHDALDRITQQLKDCKVAMKAGTFGNTEQTGNPELVQ